MSLPGAGEHLARAAELRPLVAISGRRAWRLYLVPDLAVAFGFLAAPKGRRLKVPAEPIPDRALATAFDAFDEEMRRFDFKLRDLGISPLPG